MFLLSFDTAKVTLFLDMAKCLTVFNPNNNWLSNLAKISPYKAFKIIDG